MINYDLYGQPDTWATRKLMGANTPYEVSVPTFVTTGTYGQAGWLAYQTAEQGRREIHVDESFCYIRMDKNAPMLFAKTSSAPHVTNNYSTCNRWDLYPGKNTPFGWACINSNNITGDSYRLYNTYTSVQNYVWNPKGSFFPAAVPTYYTYNSVDVPAYNGLCREPVLSFPYKQIVLVPIVNAYKFAAGKTAEDLQQATTRADYYACLGTNVHCDLRTYLTAAIALNDPTLYCEEYPIVTDIQAVPCWVTFDPDTHIATSITPLMYSAPQSNYGVLCECFVQQTPVKPDMYFYGSAVNRAEGEDVYITPGVLTHMYRSGSTTVRKSTSLTVTVYDCVLMQGADWNNQSNTNQYTWLASRCEPDGIFTLVEFTDSQLSGVYHIIDTSDTSIFREYVRRCLAYFGMYWVEGFDLTGHDIPDTMDSAECFLGIIDSQDVTHGQYVQGADIPLQPQYAWDNPIEDNPFNPGGGGGDDTEQPSDPYTPYPQPDNGFGVCLKYYALQNGDYSDLLDWISYYADYDNASAAYAAAGDTSFSAKFPDPAAWVAHICERAGFNKYPTEDIVSLMCFPFELSGTDAGYQLGYWSTDLYHDHFNELLDTPLLTGKKMSTGYKVLDMGSMDISAYYGDFRDYKPYTTLQLQVPYHGTVDLDPADWIGHTVAVTIIVDYVTGSSLAVIKRSDAAGSFAPVYTLPGQMGISVPITADSVTSSANTFAAMSTAFQSGKIGVVGDIAAGVLGVAGGAVSAVAAGLEGKTAGAIGGAISAAQTAASTATSVLQYGLTAKQQAYEMQHAAAGKMVLGTGSPSTGFAYEYRCRLVRHYPALLPSAGSAGYAALAGHACNKTGVVSDFSGFVQFGAVDLSGVDATPEEKAILLQLLQNGIFV